MAYLIEREKYGRKEIMLDVARFAGDLAPLLGGTVEPHSEERQEGWCSQEHIRVDGLMLSVNEAWNRKGKAHVSANAADILYENRPSHDGRGTYSLPDAYVSVDRPLATIAKDIKRRVIDAAAEPLANIREYAKKQAQTRDDLAFWSERIRKAVPELTDNKNNSDSITRGLYWNASGVYLSGRACADGSVHIDRLGHVSYEAFVEICDVLRRHAHKS